MAGALAYRMFIWLLPFALVLIGVLGVTADVTDESPSETAGLGRPFRPSNRIGGQCGPGHRPLVRRRHRLADPALDDPVAPASTDRGASARLGRSARARGQADVGGAVRLLTVLVVLYFLGPVIDSIWPLDGDVVVVVFAEAAIYAMLWLLVTLRLPHRNADWRALLPGAVLFAVGWHAAGDAHVLRARAVRIVTGGHVRHARARGRAPPRPVPHRTDSSLPPPSSTRRSGSARGRRA